MILRTVNTISGDEFRLIKKADDNKRKRLYVEGEINLEADWFKNKYPELYTMGKQQFYDGKLPWELIEPYNDPYDKYGIDDLLPDEENACILRFYDEFNKLRESQKVDMIKGILIP